MGGYYCGYFGNNLLKQYSKTVGRLRCLINGKPV